MERVLSKITPTFYQCQFYGIPVRPDVEERNSDEK